MLRFGGDPVPGADWVEIVHVTEKDGAPLAEDNWRRGLFGRVTLCWIAGGFRCRGAFFKTKIGLVGGKVVDVDLESESWCSTTTAQPVEVETGVYDLETNTSVYRFRLLSDEEVKIVEGTIEEILKVRWGAQLALLTDPALGYDGPIS